MKRVIYSADKKTFIDDVLHNCVWRRMEETAALEGLHVGSAEIMAWQHNAPKIKNLIDLSNVGEVQVVFEYLMPYNRSRIDCMIYGRGVNGRENAVHIELKQWSNETVKPLTVDANFEAADAEAEDGRVETLTGGAYRICAHPSQQVRGYDGYLRNFVEVFTVNQVDLTGLAYCYNYYHAEDKPQVLFDEKYEAILKAYPVYGGDDVDELADRLHDLLANGDGLSVFSKVMASPIRPSQKLLDEAGRLIHEGNLDAFSLVSEQIVAKNMIMDRVRKLTKTSKKSVLLVCGGPGTGKTVVALHLLASLAKSKKISNIRFATKSKPLLEGVRNCLPRHSPVAHLFTNTNAFLPCHCDENQFDVVLIDEAHRIQKSPNYQYMKAYERTDMSMVDMIIRSAKVCVMFIDDRQAIRGLEIGSSEMIREAAQRFDADVDRVDLVSQFRCNGSDNYLDWMEQALYGRENTARFMADDFDFRVMNSPQEVYDAIKAKNDPSRKVTARLMAGFCWPWRNELGEDGDLLKEVKIGDFAMPWETKDSIRPRPRHRPEWFKWAYDPRGIDQVGCIYTAQGFEFDYAGVIIGPDLVYNPESGQVETDYNASQDPVLKRGREGFDTYVRNIYRVLMSRGMKGCYVYCCDRNLTGYLRERLEEARDSRPRAAAPDVHILADVSADLRYRRYLPVYSLRAACGRFGGTERVEPEGWVRISGRLHKNENLFVVRAVGRSMEPLIRDGSYCVFEYCQGEIPKDDATIVLVERSSETDDETHGAYSIKKWTREKDRVVLRPLNSEFKDIELDRAEGFRIVGALRTDCSVVGV